MIDMNKMPDEIWVGKSPRKGIVSDRYSAWKIPLGKPDTRTQYTRTALINEGLDEVVEIFDRLEATCPSFRFGLDKLKQMRGSDEN